VPSAVGTTGGPKYAWLWREAASSSSTRMVAAPESGYETGRRNKDTVGRISRCCHRCQMLPSDSRDVGRGCLWGG
jgi:hypothetical protein